MDVSVVVACWNGRKLLEKSFPRVVAASKNVKNRIKEIIVIDDASQDDSVEFLKNNFPNVKITHNSKNLGYSSVCNSAVNNAKEELVVILNTDVIPSNNFLENVLPLFDDKKIFAVSFNEGKFGPGKLEWENGFLNIKSTDQIKKNSLTSWPSGGSSVFRKNIWEQLGGMDKRFLPFYFEDVDLGIRAFKNGFKCYWEPKAIVDHKHEGTINSSRFNMGFVNNIKERNHLLLVWKNIDSLFLFFSHLSFLLKRCLSHLGYLKIVFMAVLRTIEMINVVESKAKISTLEYLKICENIGQD